MPTERRYSNYFRAELLAVLILEPLAWFAERRDIYAMAYILASLIVAGAMLALAWNFLRLHPVRSVAWVFGIACAAAYGFSCAWRGPFDTIASANGCISVLMAIPAGWGAIYLLRSSDRRDGWLALGFMVMWLAEASFKAGLGRFGWWQMNEFVPAIIESFGCAALAMVATIRPVARAS